MKNSAVLLKDVTFSYPFQKPLLKDIHLEINHNQFVGIVGPNGAGKSTLLKLILGFLTPTKGEIYLRGLKLHNFTRWSKIGYVSQKASAFNSSFPATVREVIAAPLLAKSFLAKLFDKNLDSKVSKALEMVNLANHADCLIGNLSGGQQQRVFLARSLITNPEILFLDEPFVGIDENSQKSISKILSEINQQGTTLVMITHDLRWVKDKVDMLVCVEGGTIHLHNKKDSKNLDKDYRHMIYHNHQ